MRTKSRMETDQVTTENKQWYVLRDLKRANAKYPAYRLLQDQSVRMFTPMRWVVSSRNGHLVREQHPCLQDLLFAYESYNSLSQLIDPISTLQFRYIKGAWRKPMTVSNEEMDRFIYAVETSNAPVYFSPDEVTIAMLGRRVRIFGGPLNAYEGNLLAIRGSKQKRLLIDLCGILYAAVEVNPDFIQLV